MEAGRLGDQVGRRPVAFGLMAVFPFCGWLFYLGPAWVIPIGWILLVLAVIGGNALMRALTAELFPTSYRGTATGWLFVMEATGVCRRRNPAQAA